MQGLSQHRKYIRKQLLKGNKKVTVTHVTVVWVSVHLFKQLDYKLQRMNTTRTWCS